MLRRSLLLWCIILSTFLAGTGYAQVQSRNDQTKWIWNVAKRVKLGLDKPLALPPAQPGGTATMNPLSPPNTPDVQVFNRSSFSLQQMFLQQGDNNTRLTPIDPQQRRRTCTPPAAPR